METLYLSTPGYREKDGAKKFEDTIKSGIGRSFYIHEESLGRLKQGMRVVVVRRDVSKSRAEGILEKWVHNGYTKNTPPRKRYDIHFRNIELVKPYTPPETRKFFRSDGGGVVID